MEYLKKEKCNVKNVKKDAITVMIRDVCNAHKECMH